MRSRSGNPKTSEGGALPPPWGQASACRARIRCKQEISDPSPRADRPLAGRASRWLLAGQVILCCHASAGECCCATPTIRASRMGKGAARTRRVGTRAGKREGKGGDAASAVQLFGLLPLPVSLAGSAAPGSPCAVSWPPSGTRTRRRPSCGRLALRHCGVRCGGH